MIELDLSNLQCVYLPLDKYQESATQSNHPMLATVCFSSLPDKVAAAILSRPFAQVPIPSLDVSGGRSSICEIWYADGDFSYGQRNELYFGHNNDILFGAIRLSEEAFQADDQRDADKTPLQQAAESAYKAIFNLTDALKFPNILRFWNYFADINGESHGMERYRQFNMGRQDGFLGNGRKISGSAVPAASAVGYDAGPLIIYFLASRGPMPTAIENPRQVSAYQYPTEYGPRSPTFSRASVARVANDDILFLSGTASIVGHQTLHAGDVVAQTRETVANITAIVAEANRVAPQAGFALGDLCYKVYVRHERDVGAIHGELRRSFGESAQLTFLRADICRHDLLVEIEATAVRPLKFAMCN